MALASTSAPMRLMPLRRQEAQERESLLANQSVREMQDLRVSTPAQVQRRRLSEDTLLHFVREAYFRINGEIFQNSLPCEFTVSIYTAVLSTPQWRSSPDGPRMTVSLPRQDDLSDARFLRNFFAGLRSQNTGRWTMDTLNRLRQYERNNKDHNNQLRSNMHE